MKMKIFKYPLDISTRSIEAPRRWKPLSVHVQNGIPCLWAMVDPACNKNCTYQIQIVPTGVEFEVNRMMFVGTFMVENGGLVFHVFCEE